MPEMPNAELVVPSNAGVMPVLRDCNAAMKIDWMGVLAAILTFIVVVASTYFVIAFAFYGVG
jgi:hypothetical protein